MRWYKGLTVSCLLDTDICIDFLQKKKYAGVLLHSWFEKGLLSISAITQLEIYSGMRKDEEILTNALLDGLITVPVDEAIARSAGQILSKLRSRGITTGPLDCTVAATALFLNVPLITNNVDHYPTDEIPDLYVMRGTEI